VSTPAASVTIGPAVGGTWTGGTDSFFGCGIGDVFTQSGSTLTGQLAFAGACSGNITLASGSVSGTTHPTNVTWATQSFTFTTGNSNPCPSSLGGCPNLVFSFSGSTDSSGRTMSGTLTLRQTSSSFTNSNNTSFTHQ
jgi:hypothetical protein